MPSALTAGISILSAYYMGWMLRRVCVFSEKMACVMLGERYDNSTVSEF